MTAPRLQLPEPVRIARTLAARVDRLAFAPPVACVYDPLVYARVPCETYLRTRATRRVEALFLGMNPGPFGMAQTGVPFGDPTLVREWIGIEGPVDKPPREHPKRPITGFACPRGEVSGQRFWGWARDRFGTADRFFARFFVWNYCPLVFVAESGRNLTPDKLPAAERAPLFEACDDALRALVVWLEPRCVIGIGAFAQDRATKALAPASLPVHCVLHPSPASPLANRGWSKEAESQLARCGIRL